MNTAELVAVEIVIVLGQRQKQPKPQAETVVIAALMSVTIHLGRVQRSGCRYVTELW